MPIFDYKCDDCEWQFEIFFKPGERVEENVTCPNCGGKSHKVVPRGIGVKFKGSGFYETDYKRKESARKRGSCRGRATKVAPSESANDSSASSGSSDDGGASSGSSDDG